MAGVKGRSGRRKKPLPIPAGKGVKLDGVLKLPVLMNPVGEACFSALFSRFGEVMKPSDEIALNLAADLAQRWAAARKRVDEEGETEQRDGGSAITAAAKVERQLRLDLTALLKEFGGTPASRVAALHEVAEAVETVMPWDEVPPLGEELK